MPTEPVGIGFAEVAESINTVAIARGARGHGCGRAPQIVNARCFQTGNSIRESFLVLVVVRDTPLEAL